MTNSDEAGDDRAPQTGSDGVGDVEAAGETTAAAAPTGGGDDNARPVGADTQVRVEGTPHPADEADD